MSVVSLLFTIINLPLALLHITHSEKKFVRTTKAGGLNGPRSAKKREEFT